MPPATNSIATLAILEHIQDLGYEADIRYDARWHCERPFVQAGRYVFSMDVYDGPGVSMAILMLGVAVSPISQDAGIVYLWELPDSYSLIALELVLQAAHNDTSRPLWEVVPITCPIPS